MNILDLNKNSPVLNAYQFFPRKALFTCYFYIVYRQMDQ